MATKDAKEPQNNTGATHDPKADGKAADTDIDWVMAVNVECLCRPKHEHREEIGTRDKCNDKS